MGSGEIERARAARARTLEDVEVDHGGGDVCMAEEILHCSDVGAILEKTGHERVAERVAGGTLGDTSLLLMTND